MSFFAGLFIGVGIMSVAGFYMIYLDYKAERDLIRSKLKAKRTRARIMR